LVTVRFDALPDSLVQTCVSDTGCGIPPDHLDRVFHEFSKVPSTMPGSQGAQLGLFITKSFITMHKGEIRVESELGVGSRFFFTVPAVAPGAGGISPEIVSPGSSAKTA
jgi:signal transduction histidine kinase